LQYKLSRARAEIATLFPPRRRGCVNQIEPMSAFSGQSSITSDGKMSDDRDAAVSDEHVGSVAAHDDASRNENADDDNTHLTSSNGNAMHAAQMNENEFDAAHTNAASSTSTTTPGALASSAATGVSPAMTSSALPPLSASSNASGGASMPRAQIVEPQLHAKSALRRVKVYELVEDTGLFAFARGVTLFAFCLCRLLRCAAFLRWCQRSVDEEFRAHF
jgi:hypothetical protein